MIACPNCGFAHESLSKVEKQLEQAITDTRYVYKKTKKIKDQLIRIKTKDFEKLGKDQQVLLDISLRAYSWFDSIFCLRKVVHFQTASSIARSIFELYLDAIYLVTNKNKNSYVETFAAVDLINQYEQTQWVVQKMFSCKRLGKFDLEIIKNCKIFLRKNKKAFSEMKAKFGSRFNGSSRHWTGLEIEDRLDILKKKRPQDFKNWILVYKTLNAHIHSGSPVINPASLNHMAFYSAVCHRYAHTYYWRILDICLTSIYKSEMAKRRLEKDM